MPTVADLVAYLEVLAPPKLAEAWDNVGLLVGDREATFGRVMTCLTITPASTAEAIKRRADVIVSHHPLPFQALKRITTDTPTGRMLWDLIRAGVSIYSPHTAFDSAAEGINQHLAEGLDLHDINVLIENPKADGDITEGTGRWGWLPDGTTLGGLAGQVKSFLAIERVQVVGDLKRPIERVAVGCGSAGEFLTAARDKSCQCLVTGETRFHTSLEAEATEMGLILAGHYATERFGVERLAESIQQRFPEIEAWASRSEADPLVWA
jgi:dinuclear metal center YbgI/SA1388 family protein